MANAYAGGQYYGLMPRVVITKCVNTAAGEAEEEAEDLEQRSAVALSAGTGAGT
jgi:hypothetical protein